MCAREKEREGERESARTRVRVCVICAFARVLVLVRVRLCVYACVYMRAWYVCVRACMCEGEVTGVVRSLARPRPLLSASLSTCTLHLLKRRSVSGGAAGSGTILILMLMVVRLLVY